MEEQFVSFTMLQLRGYLKERGVVPMKLKKDMIKQARALGRIPNHVSRHGRVSFKADLFESDLKKRKRDESEPRTEEDGDEGGRMLAGELRHEITRLTGTLMEQHRAANKRDEELMKAERLLKTLTEDKSELSTRLRDSEKAYYALFMRLSTKEEDDEADTTEAFKAKDEKIQHLSKELAAERTRNQHLKDQLHAADKHLKNKVQENAHLRQLKTPQRMSSPPTSPALSSSPSTASTQKMKSSPSSSPSSSPHTPPTVKPKASTRSPLSQQQPTRRTAAGVAISTPTNRKKNTCAITAR